MIQSKKSEFGMRLKRKADSIAVQTPAKLNLFLEVLGKRQDGFHELATVITTIDRFDHLTIRLSKPQDGCRLTCQWDPALDSWRRNGPGLFGDLPTDERNLVYRAAMLFLEKTRSRVGLQIDLVKSIPSQAGLGGASGNAAGTLLALNELLQTRVAVEKLYEWAAELGSDVPFFIEGGCALCEGRGELVTPIHVSRKMSFVVVKPTIGMATPAVFAKLNPPAQPTILHRREMESPGFDWCDHVFNRLEEPASEYSSEIKLICEKLRKLGCRAALMTGSGSSCFGMCDHPQQANNIAQQMSGEQSAFVFTCQNLPQFSVRE